MFAPVAATRQGAAQAGFASSSTARTARPAPVILASRAVPSADSIVESRRDRPVEPQARIRIQGRARHRVDRPGHHLVQLSDQIGTGLPIRPHSAAAKALDPTDQARCVRVAAVRIIDMLREMPRPFVIDHEFNGDGRLGRWSAGSAARFPALHPPAPAADATTPAHARATARPRCTTVPGGGRASPPAQRHQQPVRQWNFEQTPAADRPRPPSPCSISIRVRPACPAPIIGSTIKTPPTGSHFFCRSPSGRRPPS